MPRLTPVGAAPQTTVVIPVYNAADEARDCIASVLRHTDLSQTRVLVITTAAPRPMSSRCSPSLKAPRA